MIRLIEGLPDGVIGIEAIGHIEVDDYRDVLIPAVEAQIKERGKIRALAVLDERYEGYTAGAAWADTKLGVETLRHWERIAVVSDSDWMRHALGAFGWLVPGEVRLFPLAEREQAVAWLAE